MTFLNRDLIHQCLQELSDKSYQEKIWTASSGPEISSFTEAICQLFDDSGLDLALKKGIVFGKPVDSLFEQLSNLLDKISDNRSPLEVINDPQMARVRELSLQILQHFPKDGKNQDTI